MVKQMVTAAAVAVGVTILYKAWKKELDEKQLEAKIAAVTSDPASLTSFSTEGGKRLSEFLEKNAEPLADFYCAVLNSASFQKSEAKAKKEVTGHFNDLFTRLILISPEQNKERNPLLLAWEKRIRDYPDIAETIDRQGIAGNLLRGAASAAQQLGKRAEIGFRTLSDRAGRTLIERFSQENAPVLLGEIELGAQFLEKFANALVEQKVKYDTLQHELDSAGVDAERISAIATELGVFVQSPQCHALCAQAATRHRNAGKTSAVR